MHILFSKQEKAPDKGTLVNNDLTLKETLREGNGEINFTNSKEFLTVWVLATEKKYQKDI